MKRVTWWPQLFLGLAFTWGALIGWTSQTGALSLAPLLLYAGSILWTIGYDTIYALQDVEDDALIGVKSTARLFGRRARMIVALFYAGDRGRLGRRRGAGGGGARCLSPALLGRAAICWAGRSGRSIRAIRRARWSRFRSNHWVGVASRWRCWPSGVWSDPWATAGPRKGPIPFQDRPARILGGRTRHIRQVKRAWDRCRL